MKATNFLSMNSLDHRDFWELMSLSRELKSDYKSGRNYENLSGKTLGMIFMKPSLRTRVSFEVGMRQMGGHAVYLGPNDIKLGERETTEDISLVLSRYVDGIMARVFDHKIIKELAKHASVPVINGLSDFLHPCQALADLFTIYEIKRELDNLKLAFIGDGNNVAHSLINGAGLVGMDFALACPKGYEPNEEIVSRSRNSTNIEISHEPEIAVENADVIYTDVWASMGESNIAEKKKGRFGSFRVDQELVNLAKPSVSIMHCLPAHYDEEISRSVAHGPNSILFEQAENRLHAQKALLSLMMN